jgi:hypothetical protein
MGRSFSSAKLPGLPFALAEVIYITMEKTSIPLEFECEGVSYKGWATPSDRLHADGLPASYVVVLNQVFFGDMSKSDGKWVLDEQRPHELMIAVGECLTKALEGGLVQADPGPIR